MHWTRATTVLNNVTWPHEVVYTDISIPLFVQGYLIAMDSEEGSVRQKMSAHLKDLMSDAEMYGWD